jgi:hypothetical protein
VQIAPTLVERSADIKDGVAVGRGAFAFRNGIGGEDVRRATKLTRKRGDEEMRGRRRRWATMGTFLCVRRSVFTILNPGRSRDGVMRLLETEWSLGQEQKPHSDKCILMFVGLEIRVRTARYAYKVEWFDGEAKWGNIQ